MRLQKETNITKRDRKILTLLLNLEQNGYVFEEMNGSAKALLSQLASDEKEYKWELLSPELIPVHVWVEEKMEKRVKVFA